MKPIVQKILESGLVNKHTALLMEKWGTLDRGASELVGKEDLREASESTLMKFVEELDSLIEEEYRNNHETRLSIALGEPFLVQPLRWTTGKIVVFLDEMENFIFPKDLYPDWLLPTGRFRRINDDQVWEIDEVTPLFVGEHRYAHQVRATKI